MRFHPMSAALNLLIHRDACLGQRVSEAGGQMLQPVNIHHVPNGRQKDLVDPDGKLLIVQMGLLLDGHVWEEDIAVEVGAEIAVSKSNMLGFMQNAAINGHMDILLYAAGKIRY